MSLADFNGPSRFALCPHPSRGLPLTFRATNRSQLVVLASAPHETGAWQGVALGQAGPPLPPSCGISWGGIASIFKTTGAAGGPLQSCPLWVLVQAVSPCSSRIRAPVPLGLWLLAVSGPRRPRHILHFLHLSSFLTSFVSYICHTPADPIIVFHP